MRLIDGDALGDKVADLYTEGEEATEADKVVNDVIDLIDNAPTVERPVIKCKDCKYQVKEWREDKRMKEKGYWAYGCDYFGDLMGYWGFGGNDDEFCSDAEIKEAENDTP